MYIGHGKWEGQGRDGGREKGGYLTFVGCTILFPRVLCFSLFCFELFRLFLFFSFHV